MGSRSILSRAAAGDDLARAAARRVDLEGTVQGVGFRPYVHGLAREHGLAGWVANTPGGVQIEIEGEEAAVDRFLSDLPRRAPPAAAIARIESAAIEVRARRGFAIAASRVRGPRRAPIAPDLATCADCLGEIFDPADRRYRYPFASCARCGPRHTIACALPYDRSRTTMARFALCAECAREYGDPADRRFHAEAICCPACGPRLRLVRPCGTGRPREIAGDPIREAAVLLSSGAIVAIKGLGGYHLAALAESRHAIARLRARKHRPAKPFAVMVGDLDAARALAEIGAAEAVALTDPAHPIVLAPRRADAELCAEVAPGLPQVGVLLAYTPLHHLLCDALRAPLVLTSGNASDEPIAHRDGDALVRLGPIADALLVHDRAIHARADDSVVRVLRGQAVPLRRSRGFAPQPLALPVPARRTVLACGGALKNTFCLARGSEAHLSAHVGDLDSHAALCAYGEGIRRFERLLGAPPALVAHDLHPDYPSTRWALAMAGVERVAVQHHHAHVAACLAEHGERGPAIGVALDGLGYGSDGTLWGGEILVADLAGFERVAHLEVLPMPGGAQAIRQPWRMACAYLAALYGADPPPGLAVVARNRARWAAVAQLARARIASPLTSSAGRLFDAVAALVGPCDAVSYEGEAAVWLEHAADASETAAYPARLESGSPMVIRGSDLFRAAVEDLESGAAAGRIAARFHNGLADAFVAACRAVRARCGLGTAALSGGAFQNALLLERTARGLERAGFRVLTHRRVPPNDGGLSFGQAAVACARDALGASGAPAHEA